MKYLSKTFLSILVIAWTFSLLALPMLYDTLPPVSVPNTGIEEIGCVPGWMPTLSICDHHETYSERKQCSDKVLVEAIYSNLKWPSTRPCVNGTAVISFTVKQNGEWSNFTITRDPGAGTGEEALRAVKLVAERYPHWNPASYAREEPVAFRVHLPVKFKLE